MGVVVGLLLGAGIVCLWSSWWEPRSRAPRRTGGWSARTQDVLVQAGLARVSPRALVVGSVGSGLFVLLVGFAVTRALPIAVCFALFAALAPVTMVRSRARRRRTELRDVWPEAVDHLASGVRAGLSLPEAVGQLGERGSPGTSGRQAGSATVWTRSRCGSQTRSRTGSSKRCA